VSDVNIMADGVAERSPMDADTLTALRGSIAKWQAIVDGTGIDDGVNNCPLCQKFNGEVLGRDDEPLDEDCEGAWVCRGCPVAEATNRDHCGGTPYVAYCCDGKTRSRAITELDFLISLLPPGETP
jgi:hypothetical protein